MAMVWSLLYALTRNTLGLMLLRVRGDTAKDVELLVLRHQVAVLGAVAADDLDTRVGPQPRLEAAGQPVGQDVDPLAGFDVDEHGGVTLAPAQGEVIDAEDAEHPPRGQRQA
jgi:hypothetical protein